MGEQVRKFVCVCVCVRAPVHKCAHMHTAADLGL